MAPDEIGGQWRNSYVLVKLTSWSICPKTADNELGSSVSLSANGTTVVIGAPYAGVNEIWTGGVKVFRIDIARSSWEQLGGSIYGDNDSDLFGISVDITHDGNTIAIGSLGYDGLGYVRVFYLEANDDIGIGDWKQIGQIVTDFDEWSSKTEASWSKQSPPNTISHSLQCTVKSQSPPNTISHSFLYTVKSQSPPNTKLHSPKHFKPSQAKSVRECEREKRTA